MNTEPSISLSNKDLSFFNMEFWIPVFTERINNLQALPGTHVFIDLSCNNIEGQALDEIIQILQKTDFVYVVDLSLNRLSVDDLTLLFNCTKIEKVNLNWNYMSVSEAYERKRNIGGRAEICFTKWKNSY